MNIVTATIVELAQREIRLRITRLALIADMVEHWRGRGEQTLAELRHWTEIGECAAREAAREETQT
jgi:hypothetical protein